MNWKDVVCVDLWLKKEKKSDFSFSINTKPSYPTASSLHTEVETSLLGWPDYQTSLLKKDISASKPSFHSS